MALITAIIPARFASTRFPGKPLVEIGGITMIQRVVTQVRQAHAINDVIVATDDERIYNHVASFAKVVMTASNLQSGTDRCASALQQLQLPIDRQHIIINIQGDEPFIQPEQIDLLANFMSDNATIQIGTLVKRIDTEAQLFNSNVVKAVFSSAQHRALYFSRQPIPFLRGVPEHEWLSVGKFYKHIGMYAYRADTLVEIASLAPSALEVAESLEQLRWLEQGYPIGIAATTLETFGIDTPEDLNVIPSDFF
jgi:3-deoxy-manno-octulosonate cytidylyltransferase (CMP-KDO synthetase)